MPDNMETILEKYPDASLSIRKEGQPTYRGENSHRIIIEGNPDAFRMLGQLLHMMADAVEMNTKTQGTGWSFLVGTEEIPQLHMDREYLLASPVNPTSSLPDIAFTPSAGWPGQLVGRVPQAPVS